MTKLTDTYKPKKTVRANFELVDFAGVGAGFSKEGADSAVMKLVRNMDALGLVVRNFESEVEGAPKPLDEVGPILDELHLADQIMVENRVAKMAQNAKKGVKGPESQVEEKALARINDQLSAEKPIRELEFSAEETKALRGFQFLTQKPVVLIVNSDEAHFGKSPAVIEGLKKYGLPVIEFSGTFEMELSQLSDAEANAFMSDAGITESARNRLTQCVYTMMGLMSFYTVGEDEVRAWTIRRGATALEAAGTIHTDLARGFIRAECFLYDDLTRLGSEKAVKEQGLLRLEGKEYVVRDGDIINVRFNV